MWFQLLPPINFTLHFVWETKISVYLPLWFSHNLETLVPKWLDSGKQNIFCYIHIVPYTFLCNLSKMISFSSLICSEKLNRNHISNSKEHLSLCICFTSKWTISDNAHYICLFSRLHTQENKNYLFFLVKIM